MEASLSKEEKFRYEKNWDRISSEKTLLTAAKDEGRMEEKIELARKARKMGLSIEDITRLTGLSVDEVQKY